ncbi:hypothetical protein GCM10010495_49700 [Kitasatospora herbaricolor]|uniref:hypothetical protein n=1 Tax=Kitasatospora herbaricolor TaxID=68217 RepID=UPI00174915C0|nr:hypothetical protein [Kitasatospora herbaricolor]MDQ0305667.1 hypothetical protein [Kitasatospora herbaricolor]GGV27561.1 hypothetical protein GCM10010495_49700 [Kitasatospora herbaricolor]
MLTRQPKDQRDRLLAVLAVLADLAEAEPEPGQREHPEAIPYASGLVEDPEDRDPHDRR